MLERSLMGFFVHLCDAFFPADDHDVNVSLLAAHQWADDFLDNSIFQEQFETLGRVHVRFGFLTKRPSPAFNITPMETDLERMKSQSPAPQIDRRRMAYEVIVDNRMAAIQPTFFEIGPPIWLYGPISGLVCSKDTTEP